VARYNKFQACRYGLQAMISDPVAQCQYPLQQRIAVLLENIGEDARALGCEHWLRRLRATSGENPGDADWLRVRQKMHGNLNDLVRDACERLQGKAN